MKRVFWGLLIFVAVFGMMSSGQAPAIPRDVKAKSEFYLAVEKFEAKNYQEAVERLESARHLLGKTNSKLQFYLVKSYWNLKRYDKAWEEIEKFFDVAADEEKNTEEYKEMVILLSKIEEQLKAVRKVEEEKRKKAEEEAEKKKAEAEEKRVYEEAISSEDPKRLKDYLAAYPRGRYVQEIRKKLDLLGAKDIVLGSSLWIGFTEGGSVGSGVKLAAVPGNTPAQRAGLRPGDVIVKIDDNRIANIGQVNAVRDAIQHGKKPFAFLEVLRGNEVLKFRLILTQEAAKGRYTGVPAPKEIERTGSFVLYDNATVLDLTSGLMWAAHDNGFDVNWEQANSYCENYRHGGFNNWRMPTLEELIAICQKVKREIGRFGLISHTSQNDGLWASDEGWFENDILWFVRCAQGSFPPGYSHQMRVIPVRQAR